MPPDLIPVDYDPFSDAANAFPSFRAPASDLPQPLFNDFPINQGFKPFNKLFGTGGETRHVLWPEQMVRRGLDVVHGASQGENQLESAIGVPGAQPTGSQDATYEPNMLGRALGMTEPWRAPSSESGIAKVQDLSGLMAGGPLIERPGAATLGSGAVRRGAGEVSKEAGNAPPFYSAVEAAVRDASQPSMSPEQWRGYLSNRPGVKAEELDWVGLPEGKKVTKQEMLDHVQEHGVQVKEVEKKGPGEIDEETARDQAFREIAAQPSKFKVGSDRWWEEHQDAIENRAYELMEGGGENGPKFSEYQLPGGDNYREKLFTFPEKTKERFSVEYKAGGDAMPPGKFDTQAQVDKFLEAAKANPNFSDFKVNRLPMRDIESNYQSSHWDEPNVLAHVRMNDRVIPDGPSTSLLPEGWQLKPSSAMDRGIGDGQRTWGVYDPKGQFRGYTVGPDEGVATSKWAAENGVDLGKSAGLRTLHLEELQSDWHQAGRKEGYKPKERQLSANDYENKLKESGYTIGSGRQLYDAQGNNIHPSKVSDDIKPLFEGWLRASNEDYKVNTRVPDAPFKTTWPDLVLKRMIRDAAEGDYDAISWTPGEAQAARYDLSKHYDAIGATKRSDGTYMINGKQVNGSGRFARLADHVAEDKLADHVGKDLAEKIVKDGGGEYSGLDLKVGGEGMKGFYDKILVDKANALAKKFGGKVEYKNIPREGGVSGTDVMNSLKVPEKEQSAFWKALEQPERDKLIEEFRAKGDRVPVLRLTPQMKDTALRKGFPLFSAGVPFPLEPVDHDPFKEDK